MIFAEVPRCDGLCLYERLLRRRRTSSLGLRRSGDRWPHVLVASLQRHSGSWAIKEPSDVETTLSRSSLGCWWSTRVQNSKDPKSISILDFAGQQGEAIIKSQKPRIRFGFTSIYIFSNISLLLSAVIPFWLSLPPVLSMHFGSQWFQAYKVLFDGLLLPESPGCEDPSRREADSKLSLLIGDNQSRIFGYRMAKIQRVLYTKFPIIGDLCKRVFCRIRL